MRKLVISILAAAVGLVLQPLGGNVAEAVEQPAGRLVSDDPAGFTPHALNGQVYSVAQVGSTMVVGGTFTTARNNGSNTVLTRNRLMAFNATTGTISTTFNPSSNGTINVVLPAGDGTVFVGGSFTSIAGQSAKNLARLRVSDGSLVTTFNGGSPTGVVKDLALSRGRLWVGGAFTHITGRAQPALATLNPNTGAFDPYFSDTIAGVHKAGSFTTVMKLAANTQNDRMAVVGNFDTLNGVRHHQLMVLDTAGATAKVADFQSDFYTATCSTSFDTYMRDVAFSPDGSFFVVSTTGAYRGYGDNIGCDTAARFDVSANGLAIAPSWVDYTGGDTSYAVEITDTAVYIGGHQRWWNNPYAGDRAGQGAVSRPGIAALNPLNGIPFSWNPTRDRGIGVFDLLNTSQGLWAVSDTDRIGNYEYHARIAMFPAAGKQVPAYTTAPFPNAVYSTARTGNNPPLQRRNFDGAAAGPISTAAGGGINWANVRGAFMVNGELYLATSDGAFTRRSFNGSTYGTPVPVNGADQVVVLQNWRSDIANATSMFYDSGRIFYTLQNSNALYYRYLNLESDIVGALRLTASPNVTGVNFSQVTGAFLGGGTLYWATSDGNLRAADWRANPQAGAPVAGTARVVSGPQLDGNNWAARALFLYQDPSGQGAGLPPTAAFTAVCVSRDCTFDATTSTAPGGSIVGYAWNFGDGSPAGSGATVTHSYTGDSAFQVQLTVTTADGQVSTLTQPVTVQRVNQPPTAEFGYSCDQLTCSFDASGSADPDGSVASYAWEFGDGGVGTGATAEHTYAAGSHTVTLTVTDNEGATATAQQQLTASEDGVAFVAGNSANGNLLTHRVQVPAQVQAGDRLLLFLTVNANVNLTAPAGWAEVKATNGSGIIARAWTKVAAATDAGSTVQVGLSAYAKGDLSVAAYRSTTGATGLGETSDAYGSGVSSLTAPAIGMGGGAIPVHYVGVKASGPVTVTLPAELSVQASGAGTGGGAISAQTANAGYATVASFGPVEAQFSASVSRAVAFVVAVTTA